MPKKTWRQGYAFPPNLVYDDEFLTEIVESEPNAPEVDFAYGVSQRGEPAPRTLSLTWP